MNTKTESDAFLNYSSLNLIAHTFYSKYLTKLVCIVCIFYKQMKRISVLYGILKHILLLFLMLLSEANKYQVVELITTSSLETVKKLGSGSNLSKITWLHNSHRRKPISSLALLTSVAIPGV